MQCNAMQYKQCYDVLSQRYSSDMALKEVAPFTQRYGPSEAVKQEEEPGGNPPRETTRFTTDARVLTPRRLFACVI